TGGERRRVAGRHGPAEPPEQVRGGRQERRPFPREPRPARGRENGRESAEPSAERGGLAGGEQDVAAGRLPPQPERGRAARAVSRGGGSLRGGGDVGPLHRRQEEEVPVRFGGHGVTPVAQKQTLPRTSQMSKSLAGSR